MARRSYLNGIPTAVPRFAQRIHPMHKLPVVPFCRASSPLPSPPNHKHHPRRPASMKRGVTADRHETWVRDAVDAGGVGARLSCGRTMLLRTAKSCGSGAPKQALKFAKTLTRRAGDGGNQAMVTKESTKETVTPSRREGRMFGSTCGTCRLHFFLQAGHGLRPAPGLPCALLMSRRRSIPPPRNARRRELAHPRRLLGGFPALFPWLFDN
jgi:hypothetical protein